MTNSDLPEVYAIELATQISPWAISNFSDCLRVGYECWVAEIDALVVGFGIITVSKAARESHILNLCVTPSQQHRGIGKKILHHLINCAAENADQTILEVRRSNTRALRLYENAGFNIIGERKNYYPASIGREDAIILALSLNI
jgi:[ribosomal protein S18]-alanine N-acetyltransferase